MYKRKSNVYSCILIYIYVDNFNLYLFTYALYTTVLMYVYSFYV